MIWLHGVRITTNYISLMNGIIILTQECSQNHLPLEAINGLTGFVRKDTDGVRLSKIERKSKGIDVRFAEMKMMRMNNKNIMIDLYIRSIFLLEPILQGEISVRSAGDIAGDQIT